MTRRLVLLVKKNSSHTVLNSDADPSQNKVIKEVGRKKLEKIEFERLGVTCRAPPSIHSSSKAQLEAERGQDVKMYCRGTGSPKPTVKWTKVVSILVKACLQREART